MLQEQLCHAVEVFLQCRFSLVFFSRSLSFLLHGPIKKVAANGKDNR